MTPLDGVTYRLATPADHAYIAATARHQVGRYVRHVHPIDVEHVTLAMLSVSRLVVACSIAEPSALLGWAAAIAGVPWFAFVPRDLRGNGIGRQLRREVIHDYDSAQLRHLHRREDERPAHDGPAEGHADATRDHATG